MMGSAMLVGCQCWRRPDCTELHFLGGHDELRTCRTPGYMLLLWLFTHFVSSLFLSEFSEGKYFRVRVYPAQVAFKRDR